MALSPGQIVASLAPIVGRVGAAGIAGNLMQESSDNPASGGGGLAQWQGGRYTGLVKYAQSRGLPTTSAQAALGYLAQDLKGPYSGLAAQLRQAKDPGTAATLFSNIYERPGTPMLGNRIGYAQQALGDKSSSTAGTLPQSPGSSSVTVPTFDQAGYNKANSRYIAGSFLNQSSSSPWDIGPKGANIGPNPLLSTGLLTTKAPNVADFQGTKTLQQAQSKLQQAAGSTVLTAHQGLQSLPAGSIAAGFLPKGAQYIQGRKDQGRDGQTNPGGAVLANGKGFVVAVKSDPNGFGPSYPVIHFTSGPYAGRTLYFGHTLSTVQPGQQVTAGQVISHTGTHGIGNATVPGWFEIGFADSGSPGPVGQPAPF
jgi:hypothetical protein